MKAPNYMQLPQPDLVRKRPGMYIGGSNLFGFINYLVCPFKSYWHVAQA